MMVKRLYRARTTFRGADSPSEFYFNTRKKAERFIAEQDNGEIDAVEIRSAEPLNYGDGRPWNELTWGGEVAAYVHEK